MPNRLGIAGAVTLAAIGLCVTAMAAERADWIVDESNRCGTGNPFPNPGESIRWYGDCRDGRLHGRGILIWYRDNVETERDEGTFSGGELVGEAIITYPDGHVIVGHYDRGRRHGRFVTVRPDGAHLQASYVDGELRSQRTLSPQEIAAWKRERAARLTASLPAGTPRLAQAGPRSAASVTPSEPVSPAVSAADPSAKLSGLSAAARAGAWIAKPKPAPTIGTEPRARQLAPRSAGSGPATPPPLLYRPPLAAPVPLSRRATVRQRPTATELARFFAGAGNHGTGQDGFAAPLVPPRLRPPPRPNHFTALAAPTPQPPVPAASGGQGTTAADKAFAEGYRAERAGRFYEAEKAYEKIMVAHPSAPSAMLANARLESLRARGSNVRVGGRARVVAVNAPNPVRSQSEPGTRVGRLSLYKDSADLGRTVCTINGLYEDGAKWCGIIIRDEVSHFRVEVRRVELPGFGTIGIGRSTCTGNTFINWFSRGGAVRVPKQCMSYQS